MDVLYKNVNKDDEGMRLDRWAMRACNNIPFTLVVKAIRKGDIKVNKKSAKLDTRVAAGDIVRIAPHLLKIANSKEFTQPKKTNENKREKIKKYIDDFKSWIVFEDKDVVVINKPSGFASQGGSGIKVSVDSILQDMSTDKDKRYVLVHRLDKETSGLLVIAKNLRAARMLNDAFSGRAVRKSYWALTLGTPAYDGGEINAPLIKKGIRGNEKIVVDYENGQKSKTAFLTQETLGNSFAWLILEPLTGRTHQLRVHLSEVLKTPIVNDFKYGATEIEGLEDFPNKMMLHAKTISFPLPSTGKHKTVVSELPAHFKKAMKMFELRENEVSFDFLPIEGK